MSDSKHYVLHVALEWLSSSCVVEGDLPESALRFLRLTLSRASRAKDVVAEAGRTLQLALLFQCGSHEELI